MPKRETTETALAEANRAAEPEDHLLPPGAWSGAKAVKVPTDALLDDPTNPRAVLRPQGEDQADLEALAESLRAVGMLEPIVAVPVGDDPPELIDGQLVYKRLMIRAGHRRRVAARLAGWEEVPVLVRADLATDRGGILAALVENLQRVALTPLEEARGYSALRELGLSQQQIAKRTGRNQGTVSKRLSLLKLPEEVQRRVEAETLPVDTAVELARLPKGAVDDALRYADQPGVPLERAVGQARREHETRVAVEAAIQRLEEGRLALVDYPAHGTWSASREDAPLTDGPTGTTDKPAGVAWAPAIVPVSIEDHADQPCHGATVRTDALAADGSAIVVALCLDPSRHGGTEAPAPATGEPGQAAPGREVTPEQQAEAQERQRRRELAVAASEARMEAIGRLVGHAQPGLPVMANHVAAMALEAAMMDVALLEPAEAVNMLEPTLPTLEAGAYTDQLVARVRPVMEARGEVFVAFVATLLGAESAVTHDGRGTMSTYHRPLIRRHLLFLRDWGGYVAGEVDAPLLELEAPEPEPDAGRPLPKVLGWYTWPDDTPTDVVAFYRGSSDDDPERFLTDTAEAVAIADTLGEQFVVWHPDTEGVAEAGLQYQEEQDDDHPSDGLPCGDPSCQVCQDLEVELARSAAMAASEAEVEGEVVHGPPVESPTPDPEPGNQEGNGDEADADAAHDAAEASQADPDGFEFCPGSRQEATGRGNQPNKMGTCPECGGRVAIGATRRFGQHQRPAEVPA